MVELSKSVNKIENRTQQQVESSLYMPSMYDTDYSDSDEEGIEEIPSPFNLLRSLAWSQDDQDGEINMDVDERPIMSLSSSRLYQIDSASSILIEEDADKENAADVTVEPIEPDWEVTKWDTSPMIAIPKPLWQ